MKDPSVWSGVGRETASVRQVDWEGTSISLLLDRALDVEGFDAVDFGEGAVDSHDLSNQFDRLLTELGQSFAARIVFLIHQDVHGSVLRQQADRLAVADALLSAFDVLFAMLADLKIAREINDVADESGRFSRNRFAHN